MINHIRTQEVKWLVYRFFSPKEEMEYRVNVYGGTAWGPVCSVEDCGMRREEGNMEHWSIALGKSSRAGVHPLGTEAGRLRERSQPGSWAGGLPEEVMPPELLSPDRVFPLVIDFLAMAVRHKITPKITHFGKLPRFKNSYRVCIALSLFSVFIYMNTHKFS